MLLIVSILAEFLIEKDSWVGLDLNTVVDDSCPVILHVLEVVIVLLNPLRFCIALFVLKLLFASVHVLSILD